MRGMDYRRASRRADEGGPHTDEVEEALANQAARRAPRTPPREMPNTPTLPRAGNKRRKKRRG